MTRPTGVALLGYHLSKFSGSEVLHSDLSHTTLVSIGDHALLASMDSAISKGVRRASPSHVSFLETDVGVATLVLLRLLSGGPVDQSPFFKGFEFCLQVVQTAVESVNNYEEDACEVLYGRAGLLYALLYIRDGLSKARASRSSSADLEPLLLALSDLTSDQVLRVVVNSIIDIGREGAAEYIARLESSTDEPMPPLMWVWHGRRYLGAAHGVAGILFVLWNCPSSVVEPYSEDLVKTLEWLVDLQDSTGNWPSKAPADAINAEHNNELVQWCHGATGILILLSKASLHREWIILDPKLHEKVNFAIRKGAHIVYRHGLLTKGVGICHGVAGSVYALLAASRVLDTFKARGGPLTDRNTKYLRRAVHLAVLATESENLTKNGEMRTPDRPWSLYEGSAGMCCAWADVLCSLTGRDPGGVPGFDDL
ncbi:hypothetical protein H2248_003465 [Termitomyces sp. 'cryptogamus']|nr:hypothetical protein H2248_003465 [Termitomyces sp. 'cryptogamus']